MVPPRSPRHVGGRPRRAKRQQPRWRRVTGPPSLRWRHRFGQTPPRWSALTSDPAMWSGFRSAPSTKAGIALPSSAGHRTSPVPANRCVAHRRRSRCSPASGRAQSLPAISGWGPARLGEGQSLEATDLTLALRGLQLSSLTARSETIAQAPRRASPHELTQRDPHCLLLPEQCAKKVGTRSRTASCRPQRPLRQSCQKHVRAASNQL